METFIVNIPVKKRTLVFSPSPASLPLDGWVWGPTQVKGEFEFTDQPASDPTPHHVVDAPAS